MHRFFGLLVRIFHGENILLVPQTKDQWDSQFSSGTWDRLLQDQPNTALIAQRIRERAIAKNGRMRVLDVGCGNGGLAAFLKEDSRIDYVGLDIAASAIASAREVAPQGMFIEANAAQPPRDLGIFDVLVFNELLYYLDPRIALASYRNCAGRETDVYISIAHSWRSWFLWRSIGQHMRISHFETIAGFGNRWDIAIGKFP